MRIIHLLVIGLLVFAAAHVYRIKMDSTVRTERVLKLQAEIRDERNAIASLRAEWARLDAPSRLQGLAERHTELKPIAANQFDQIKNLPMRSSEPKPSGDPLTSMIDVIDGDIITGTLPPPPVPSAETDR
jgi:hypothetical protein